MLRKNKKPAALYSLDKYTRRIADEIEWVGFSLGYSISWVYTPPSAISETEVRQYTDIIVGEPWNKRILDYSINTVTGFQRLMSFKHFSIDKLLEEYSRNPIRMKGGEKLKVTRKEDKAILRKSLERIIAFSKLYYENIDVLKEVMKVFNCQAGFIPNTYITQTRKLTDTFHYLKLDVVYDHDTLDKMYIVLSPANDNYNIISEEKPDINQVLAYEVETDLVKDSFHLYISAEDLPYFISRLDRCMVNSSNCEFIYLKESDSDLFLQETFTRSDYIDAVSTLGGQDCRKHEKYFNHLSKKIPHKEVVINKDTLFNIIKERKSNAKHS